MKREYYSDSIPNFQKSKPDEILGILARNNDFPLEQTQRNAWLEEINILQKVLSRFEGSLYFEYSIPRMGKRIDVVLLIGPAIFVLEFKIGEKEFLDLLLLMATFLLIAYCFSLLPFTSMVTNFLTSIILGPVLTVTLTMLYLDYIKK